MRYVDGRDGSDLGRVTRLAPDRLELRPATGPPLTIGQPEPGADVLLHRDDLPLGELTAETPKLTARTFTANLGPHGTWTVTVNAFGTRYRITAEDRRLATARHPLLSRTLTLAPSSDPAPDPTLLLAVVLAARLHRTRDSAFTE